MSHTRVFVLFTAFSLWGASASFAQQPYDLKSSGEKVRVRSAPGLTTEVLGHLSKDEVVSILERSTFSSTIDGDVDHWFRVAGKDGKEGWVFGKYLEAPADKLMGLLTLPQIYGNSPEQKYTPRDVPLYAAPQASAPIAHLRVKKIVRYGGDAFTVRIYDVGGSERGGPDDDSGGIPNEEYEYEQPAAIVLEKKGDWHRIRLNDGSGWVRAEPENRFLSLEELLGKAPYIQTWDGFIWDAQGGTARPLPLARDGIDVRILAKRIRDGRLWFQIEIPEKTSCDDAPTGVKKTTGWVPAYAKDGKPTLWFMARGC